MTKIYKPVNLSEEVLKNVDPTDYKKIQNPALKKILEENSKEEKPDLIQAYDRMYHTHNRS